MWPRMFKNAIVVCVSAFYAIKLCSNTGEAKADSKQCRNRYRYHLNTDFWSWFVYTSSFAHDTIGVWAFPWVRCRCRNIVNILSEKRFPTRRCQREKNLFNWRTFYTFVRNWAASTVGTPRRNFSVFNSLIRNVVVPRSESWGKSNRFAMQTCKTVSMSAGLITSLVDSPFGTHRALSGASASRPSAAGSPWIGWILASWKFLYNFDTEQNFSNSSSL